MSAAPALLLCIFISYYIKMQSERGITQHQKTLVWYKRLVLGVLLSIEDHNDHTLDQLECNHVLLIGKYVVINVLLLLDFRHFLIYK